MTPAAPSGVVTFLLTDVEGSTRRWEADAEAMRAALAAQLNDSSSARSYRSCRRCQRRRRSRFEESANWSESPSTFGPCREQVRQPFARADAGMTLGNASEAHVGRTQRRR